MPAGATLKLSSPDRRPWSDAVREAAQWSRREGPVFFIAQCRDVAQELYQQTAAIAPSKGEIAADVKAQGWEIPKTFTDPGGHVRTGRGEPYQWANAAVARQDKSARRRGRPRKGEERAARAQKIQEKGATLAQMQRFVIAIRSKARLFLASGWLGALADLGGSLKTSSGTVDHDRGGADIRRDARGVTVSLWNRTPGMAEQDAKHRIVEKAIAVRLLDLAKYMTDRSREAYGRIFRR